LVYICKTILVMEIICYQYSTTNNFDKKIIFLTKCGSRFKSLLGIKYAKYYSNSFRFDIIIARCLRGQFFTGHSVVCCKIWYAITASFSVFIDLITLHSEYKKNIYQIIMLISESHLYSALKVSLTHSLLYYERFVIILSRQCGPL